MSEIEIHATAHHSYTIDLRGLVAHALDVQRSSSRKALRGLKTVRMHPPPASRGPASMRGTEGWVESDAWRIR